MFGGDDNCRFGYTDIRQIVEMYSIVKEIKLEVYPCSYIKTEMIFNEGNITKTACL